MLNLWAIHFKSESGDNYFFTVKSHSKPELKQLTKWLFEELQVDTGTEGWDLPHDEIPYSKLEINLCNTIDKDFDND